MVTVATVTQKSNLKRIKVFWTIVRVAWQPEWTPGFSTPGPGPDSPRNAARGALRNLANSPATVRHAAAAAAGGRVTGTVTVTVTVQYYYGRSRVEPAAWPGPRRCTVTTPGGPGGCQRPRRGSPGSGFQLEVQA